MDFYEKMNKAERLFKVEKQLRFLNPKFGLYGVVLGLILGLFSFDSLALLVNLTVIVTSLIGIVLLLVSSKAFGKALSLHGEASGEIFTSDAEETNKRLKRHKEIFEIMLKS